MAEFDIVRRLNEFFDSAGTERGVGVSKIEVVRFAQQQQVKLPPELETYFESCNGTNGDYARGMICFWSLEQVRTLASELTGSKGNSPAMIHSAYKVLPTDSCQLYVFADFMHESQLYAIRLGPEGTKNEVVLVDGNCPRVVAASLTEFLERFMDEPASIGADAD